MRERLLRHDEHTLTTLTPVRYSEGPNSGSGCIQLESNILQATLLQKIEFVKFDHDNEKSEKEGENKTKLDVMHSTRPMGSGFTGDD